MATWENVSPRANSQSSNKFKLIYSLSLLKIFLNNVKLMSIWAVFVVHCRTTYKLELVAFKVRCYQKGRVKSHFFVFEMPFFLSCQKLIDLDKVHTSEQKKNLIGVSLSGFKKLNLNFSMYLNYWEWLSEICPVFKKPK